MSSYSSSSSSSKYDVFISFRGEDTRDNFISHLYAALCRKKIKTFIDDEGIRRGEEISPSLLNAIEESTICVIVFSENYASSRWCLDELVKILECHEMNGQIVIPVFYRVDPSDVRKQTGGFGDAFVEHVKRFEEMPAKVEKWRDVLTQACYLSGWDSMTTRPEAQLVELIVKDILEKLEYMTHPSSFGGLVGIKSHIEEIKSLLFIEMLDFRIVGIWGMAGIGKTTIARAVFDQISSDFDGKCLMINVKEESERVGLVHVRKRVLSLILDEDLELGTRNLPKYFKKRLQLMKVFIVLDDVSKSEELEYLAHGLNRFGSGSRIIVTTRDKRVLDKCGVEYLYKVEGLDHHNSLELFSNYSFKQSHCPIDLLVLSKRVVDYANGNPLALKVLGSFLHQRSKVEWENALKSLKRISHPDIYDVLKISYNELKPKEKSIFLDIACFFNGEDQDYVRMIHGDSTSVKSRLNGLVDKSLITTSCFNKLQMHDLLQEMGREIVRQESSKEPGKRSRLWFHENLLGRNTVTDAMEESLDLLKIRDMLIYFPKMPKLRNLKLYTSQHFGVPIISSTMHLLDGSDWHKYPLRTMALSFYMKNLTGLILPYGKVEQIWEPEREAFKCFAHMPNLILLDFHPYLPITSSKVHLPQLLKHLNEDSKYLQSLRKLPLILDTMKLRELNLSYSNVEEIWEEKKKLDVECDKLDSHVRAYWNHTDLKQLHLKLAEVHYLLEDGVQCGSDQNLIIDNLFTDLRGLTYDVDELIDDWEHSEISKSKFDQEIRRILQQLVGLLNLLHKLATGHEEESSAISELSSRRSDDHTVSEGDLVHLINKIYYELLRDVNVVRILPILGMGGTGKTVLAQRVYTDKKMKSHFPFRVWFSIGKNLDLSTVLNAIAVQFNEIRNAENMEYLSERLLVVLDDVCDIDDEKLHNFRLLISNMHDSGSCFLVTTRSHSVATMMSSVSEGQLMTLPKLDSEGYFKSELALSLGAAQSPVLEHGENLRLMAPESLVMTEPRRHSTSGRKAVMTSDLSGRFKLLSESVPAAERDSMPFLFEDPASRPETLTENQMKYSPQPDKRAIHELEVQTNPRLNACVKPSVESIPVIKLCTSNVTAVNHTKRNVQKILRCVNDVTASKIGVYGVGGIGKTAALKALISYPEIKNMFHVIIWVTVSRYWNMRKIQNEVLRQLSLCREDQETDAQVAEKLWQVLKGKKFLLLLDDVWEKIDLEAVGVPVTGSENGSKIIMASRELDVYHKMDVSMVVKLETLSRKEAWELFCKEVGGIIQSPDIQLYARAIANGCFGLPLLTIITGKALTGESNVSVWEHASRKFSLPITAEECCVEDLIQLLKFSFDQLKDHDIKSCFLHFSLFPEDREVSIVEFIDYCIQEGVIVGTLADARKRGLYIVDVLVHASLLIISEDRDSIKMHCLIKDLALGILLSSAGDSHLLLRGEGCQFLLRAYSRIVEPTNAKTSSSSSSLKSPESSRMFIPEAHQVLLRARAGLTEPPAEEEWKCAKMIFLMDNELCTLPERPSCPNLLTLFLQRNCRLRMIPPSFFELMTSLKVLNLSKTRIKSLPPTLVNLKCLQILILRECELLLVLPSEVGSLECLEVLDLEGTEINKLPDEISKLASLRYLNVFFYGSMDRSENIKLPCNLVSSGTLSGLPALESLSMVVYPGDKRWDEDVKHVVTEVSNLTKLSSLCFHFPKTEYVAEFLKGSVAWKKQQLTEFKFVVGHDVKSIVSRVSDYAQRDYNQHARCLRFVNGKSVSPEVVQILARCTAFYVDNHLSIDSLSDFGVSNTNGLKFCIISECPKIKTVVVDIKEHTTAVLSSLENLTLNHLWNLTCIWEGILPKGSFAELRILSVHACQQLEYIFSNSMIQFLTKLEELTVEYCPSVKSIILDVEITDSSGIMLPSLKKLRLHHLPELVDIWTNDWPPLEYISFYGCPKLKKIGMDSKLKDTVIWIKAEKKWWAELEWNDTELPIHFEDRLSMFSEDDEDQEPSFCT